MTIATRGRYQGALKGLSRRVPISLRIDPDVLEALRVEAALLGVPYQSLINDILAVHSAYRQIRTPRKRA